MKKSNRTTCGLVTALACAGTALGQSRQVPAPPQDRPIVIHSATVHPVVGEPIADGYVVLEAGRIAAVGAGAAPEIEGARRHDADGLHVYPGLIAAHTQLGVSEVGSVDVTQDHTEYGRVTPEVRAAVAVNPDSDLIPVARANGILTAMVFPQGGVVAGRCSLMRLDGWTWEQMAIDDAAGLVVNWPRTEPITAWWMNRSEAEQRREIRDDLEAVERIFDEAQAYLDARDANEDLATDLRYEAMASALRGERPVYVQASSMGQIESAVGWASRRGLDIVIVGGGQADRVIPLLKKHDVPVILQGLHRLPGRRDAAYDEPFVLPRKLHDAGIRFAIASGAEPAHERNLNHNVATAAAYGLSRAHALRAVTLGAAEILGVGDTHGSLEKGKAATLIVTNGDPLEITTDVLMAFIDGREIDLGSRHEELHQKYREKYRQLGVLEE